jgi:hypothetical protein
VSGLDGADRVCTLVLSRWERIQAAQQAKSADVVSNIFHPDFGLGPNQTNGFHYWPNHVVRLRAEHMLGPNPDQ